MRMFVVGTGAVDASAALCDYLDSRLGGDDVIHAAAWAGGDGSEADRDAADALNGVRSRLGVRVMVETHRVGEESGDGVVDGLHALAGRVGAGELVVGSGGDGGLDPAAVGALVAEATRPVVAVPLDG